jgi:hypothetical protein
VQPEPWRGAAEPREGSTEPWAGRGRTDLWVSLGLVFATFALYAASLGNGFVALDDPFYVTANPVAQRGLTWEGVRLAFADPSFANWLPVTSISHMLDCELFGLNPAGHHATSALLHAANAALVYLLMVALTGSRRRSLVVAALFAAHPLRVESVSWVSERKDVLCGTFFLLTLLAYAWYARRPGLGRYAVVAAAYALGLMSKTMIVTAPGVMLLLDAWPLRRASRPAGPAARGVAGSDGVGGASAPPWRGWPWLAAEKLPFVAMAAVATAWTVVLQGEGAALAAGAHLTLGQRVANAVVSVPRYLGDIVRPMDLSVLYVHPGDWARWQVAGAAVLVTGLTIGAVVVARRKPYVAVGWLWFLGMLLPVLGIVQVGDQAMADRYTYLPSIGLTMAVVWAAADAAASRPRLRAALGPALAVVLVALAAGTWAQQRYWRDTPALAGRALDVDPDNWAAHQLLGSHLLAAGDTAGAVDQFVAASRGLRAVGRIGEAVEMSGVLAARVPGRADVLAELGRGLLAAGRLAEAAARLREALRFAADDPDLRRQIEEDLARTGGP